MKNSLQIALINAGLIKENDVDNMIEVKRQQSKKSREIKAIQKQMGCSKRKATQIWRKKYAHNNREQRKYQAD